MAGTLADRVGILGGTFDPPHIGHAIIARDLVEALDLDTLLVIPAARPPHRDAVMAPDVRLDLVRRAFAGEPRIEVCDVEYRREGPSYTIDTLEWLAAERPESKLFLVIGADQLAELDTWRDPERIAGFAELIVMRRAGEEPRAPDGMDPIEYITVDVTRIDVSASRIRERLRCGQSIRFFVPEAIRAEIERAWLSEARPEPVSTRC